MMMKPIRFEDNIGLVHLQAKQGYKWAQGAGLALDYEDMVQEASEAFVIAVNGFNPEHGVKFSAYYTQVCFSQFRKTIGVMTGVKNLNVGQREEIAAAKAENKRRAAAALPPVANANYGLNPTVFSALDGNGDDGFTPFEATLESTAMTPEDIAIARDLWEKKSAHLSPLARLVADWLRDPPEALVKELDAQLAHANALTEQGVKSRGMRDGISIVSISRFLQLVANVSARDVSDARNELLAVVDAIEKEDHD